MSPELKSALPLPSEEALQLHQPYTILNVEEVKTEVQQFLGVRVTVDGNKGMDSLLAIMLWTRDVVGRASKLGCFMDLLGTNTDNWIGKTVEFVNWTPKNREIILVDAPKPKVKGK